jgi:RNA polymerase sigma-70 factor (ECF subfamily)
MPESSGTRTATDAKELSDGELARRIASAGDSVARDEEAELCRRFGRRLVYFGRRRVGSEDRARDLAQDTLLLTLEKLRSGKVREPGKIGAFILGVARTLSSTQGTREARSRPLDEVTGELVHRSVAPPDPIASSRVAPCVEALPETHRAVILLSFYGEQTSVEVAASLGLTPSHVRVLRHRGVTRLRDCLGFELERDAA